MAIYQYRNICFQSYLFSLGTKPFREGEYCYSTNLIYTIAHYSMLFPTISWPTTSALAANFAYLYMLPLCTFFSSLYHNVVIQSTLLQHYNTTPNIYPFFDFYLLLINNIKNLIIISLLKLNKICRNYFIYNFTLLHHVRRGCRKLSSNTVFIFIVLQSSNR